MSKRNKLVVAGNFQQFREFLLQFEPKDRVQFQYVRSRDVLLSRDEYELILYGTWFERNDIRELKEEHLARKYKSDKVTGDF